MGFLDIFKGKKKKQTPKPADTPELTPSPLPPAPNPMPNPVQPSEQLSEKQPETTNPAEPAPGLPPVPPPQDALFPPSSGAANELSAQIDQMLTPQPQDPAQAQPEVPVAQAVESVPVPQPVPTLAPQQPLPNLPQDAQLTAEPLGQPPEQHNEEIAPPPPLEVQSAPVQEPQNADLDTLNSALDAMQPEALPAEQQPNPQAEDLPPVPEIPHDWSTQGNLVVPPQNLEPPQEPQPTISAQEKQEIIAEMSQLEENKSDIPQAIPSIESFGQMPSVMKVNEELKDINEDLERFRQPHFVRADSFEHVSASVNSLNTMLKETDRVFSRMQELRLYKEKKLNEWQKSVEDIQRKLVYLDNKLFEVA